MIIAVGEQTFYHQTPDHRVFLVIIQQFKHKAMLISYSSSWPDEAKPNRKLLTDMVGEPTQIGVCQSDIRFNFNGVIHRITYSVGKAIT